jgi:hypothetical protein
MKKQSDRVRDWRERQKADGKTSITVLLSPEAREILAQEKEQSAESYSVIVEKALLALKKQGHGLPGLKPFRPEKGKDRSFARAHQRAVMPAASSESAGESKKLLIDDLANYPSLKDLELEQAQKKENGLYDFKSRKGFMNRLFSPSPESLGRKKKWFQ